MGLDGLTACEYTNLSVRYCGLYSVLVHVTKKDEVLYSLPVCFIEELFAYSLLCLLLLHMVDIVSKQMFDTFLVCGLLELHAFIIKIHMGM